VIPLTSLLVWHAVLASDASLPVTGRYLVAYFLLVGVVEMLTASWIAFFLAESIRDGSLNQWLVRPTSTHLNAITNNLGEKVIKLLLLVPVVIMLGVVLSITGFGDHRLELPTEASRWAGFGLAVLLAAAIRFSLDVVIGSLAFWVEDVQGFLRAVAVIIPVLSGGVVPLALMPDGWQEVAVLQPFRFMLSFPLEVLLSPDAGAAGGGFAGQVGWLMIFVAAAVLTWRAGLRSYSAAGA
jgi:ABC-2 type transport system permease protein